MSCIKFFSRALLSLFVFNSLNVVFTSAMEVTSENDKKVADFEEWCGNYSFNEHTNKEYSEFMKLLEQHKQLFNDHGITLKEDIKDFYIELFLYIYHNTTSGSAVGIDELRKKLIKLTNMQEEQLSTINETTLFNSYIYNYKYNCKDKNKSQLYFSFSFSNEKLTCIELGLNSSKEEGNLSDLGE